MIFLAAPFFLKPLPPSVDVMEGFNIQMDCYVEGSVELLQYKSSGVKHMKQSFARQGFEGRYQRFSSSDMPSGGRASREPRMEGPTFERPLSDLEVLLGSEAVFTCTVTGRPQPEITW